MIRYLFHITLVSILLLSCQTNKSQNNSPKVAAPEKKQREIKYCNEFGEVLLVPQDSSYKVTFYKNDSVVFDTLFYLNRNQDIFDTAYTRGKNILQLRYSFIIFDEHTLTVQDISNIAYMPAKTGIKNLYFRDFYRCDTTTIINGKLTFGKGGPRIEGIYLDQKIVTNDTNIVQIKGKIIKEKYPRAFYSTHESPQGMFPDTTGDHYRLVLKNSELAD